LETVLVNEKQFRMIEKIVSDKEVSVEKLAEYMNEKPESLMRDIAELENRGLLETHRLVVEKTVLTQEALDALSKGLPEERVHRVMYRCVDKQVEEFIDCVSRETGLDREIVRIGVQYLIRERCLEISRGIVLVGNEENCFRVVEKAGWIKAYLKTINGGMEVSSDIYEMLRRRKLVSREKKTLLILKPSNKLAELYEKGLITYKELITVVKPSIAKELDKYVIKEFDLKVAPPTPRGGKINSYMEFIDMVRDILIAMGFEEAKGPHVELEFWNFDALFQAQDHPAREIHDTFYLDTSFQGRVKRELLSRAKRVHEEGWRYKWDPLRALRPILRSQMTAVSMRAIFEKGEGEYRVFALDRVFRPETLDAKHAMEFYQLDGIIVGREISFKHLLSFFKEFAAALGIREVWFKPGYFPFTEPSVEGFIKHPDLGWVEVFPGGVFRPEVMKILGASGVRAIAWGIGIDRIAMTLLGLNDIRDLFNKDLDFLRKLKTPIIPYYFTKVSGREVDVVKIPR